MDVSIVDTFFVFINNDGSIVVVFGFCKYIFWKGLKFFPIDNRCSLIASEVLLFENGL